MALVGIPFFALLIFLSATAGDYWDTLLFTLGLLSSVVVAYVLQDRPPTSSVASEYSEVIKKIESLGTQLSELGSFLERERARVTATEETIQKLSEERAKLEPLVHTQRETVEAVLAAHAERTVRTAWKERFIGFAIGVVVEYGDIGNKKVRGHGSQMAFQSTKRVLDMHVAFEEAPELQRPLNSNVRLHHHRKEYP